MKPQLPSNIHLLENETFEFVANRDIQPDEEIFTYYGGVDYWNDGRNNTEVI